MPQDQSVSSLSALLALAALPSAHAQSASCAAIPAWNASTIYNPGDKLVYQNHLYQANIQIWNAPPTHCPSCGWYTDLGTCGTGGGNVAPSVTLTAPGNGASVAAGSNIAVSAQCKRQRRQRHPGRVLPRHHFARRRHQRAVRGDLEQRHRRQPCLQGRGHRQPWRHHHVVDRDRHRHRRRQPGAERDADLAHQRRQLQRRQQHRRHRQCERQRRHASRRSSSSAAPPRSASTPVRRTR